MSKTAKSKETENTKGDDIEVTTPKVDMLQHLIRAGVPCSSVKLHQSADNVDKTPETFFAKSSDKPTRKADGIWFTPIAVVISQKNLKKETKYIVIPHANVISAAAE